MGKALGKSATAKNQSKTTTTAPVIHQTLTSTRRASIHSNSSERRPSITDGGKERRPSLTREPPDLTRSTVASTGKTVDNTNRPRRASVQPRTSTVMEEPPGVQSSKNKGSSGGKNIFSMCCGTSSTAKEK